MSAESTRRRTGRRPGTTTSREAIRVAAQTAFERDGYAATSIRGVARTVGVDPALPIHFFGSKAGLFMASVIWPRDPAEQVADVLANGPDLIAANIARSFVALWQDPGSRRSQLAMLQVATSGHSDADRIRDFLQDQFLVPINKILGLEWLALNLITGELLGLAMARYVMKFEPLASEPVEHVVQQLTESIQRHITRAQQRIAANA